MNNEENFAEQEAALIRDASDLFDELSVAGLALIDEKTRQQFRKVFIGGYLVGWGQGHTNGMVEAVLSSMIDKRKKKS